MQLRLTRRRVLALTAALTLTLAARTAASPLPPGGRYPIPGAPAFLTGTYYQVSPQTGVRISVIEDNQIGTWSLGNEPDAAFMGSYLVIKSFICLDANTALYMVAGVRSDDTTIPGSCSVSYVNATHAVMRWYVTPAANPQDACPDTPFGDDPNAVTVVYKRAEDVPPPPTLVCKNETVTPPALLNVTAELTGPHSPPDFPPVTPYPLPGVSSLNAGLMKFPGVDHLCIGTDTGYASVRALPTPGKGSQQTVNMYNATYLNHECLGPNLHRAYAYTATYFINGTILYEPSCELARREQLGNGTEVLRLAIPTKNITDCPPDLFDSPDARILTLAIIEDLPWMPGTGCSGGGMSPSPKPSPSPPSGASAAGIALLSIISAFILI